jgi:hypothetical protein
MGVFVPVSTFHCQLGTPSPRTAGFDLSQAVQILIDTQKPEIGARFLQESKTFLFGLAQMACL